MKNRSFILAVLTLLVTLTIFTSTVSAATYQATGTRGVKFLAWSESKLLWSTNSTRVTASDAYQDHSGLFVRNRGTTKVSSLSSSTQRSEERRVGKEDRHQRRRHTRLPRDWSSDVCSSDLYCFCSNLSGNRYKRREVLSLE